MGKRHHFCYKEIRFPAWAATSSFLLPTRWVHRGRSTYPGFQASYSLTLVLKETFPVNAISEPGGVIVSYDDAGEPVSVEFLNASKRELIRPGKNKGLKPLAYSRLFLQDS